jgi:hypothetical protein
MLSEREGGNTMKKHVNLAIVLVLVASAALLAAAHGGSHVFGFFSGG